MTKSRELKKQREMPRNILGMVIAGEKDAALLQRVALAVGISAVVLTGSHKELAEYFAETVTSSGSVEKVDRPTVQQAVVRAITDGGGLVEIFTKQIDEDHAKMLATFTDVLEKQRAIRQGRIL